MPDESESQRRLEALWTTPRGVVGALSAVNNQVIGRRFMYTAFAFFLAGGVLALLIRVQLAWSGNTFLGPERYNQIFTMHGSTMMYLFVVPFLEGLAVYLLPLLVGSRDLAFPRLTAFGYWTFLFGGLVFYASFLFGTVPDAGWFAYTPLSGPRYSGLGVDFWLLGLSLVEIGGITAGVELVATTLKLRAPGMSLNRMPLLAWAFLVTGIMIVFAFTTLLTATMLLELDRTAGTCFFTPEKGGSTLLWQHLFWFFGHPEVYIAFIPATGIVSMVVPVFSRRPLAAYVLVVVAIMVTGFVSFGLWVHHMYTTGIPTLSMSFFAVASLMIALASGTQIFAWIATMWGARPALTPPMMYVLGFIFIFVLGGMTGVMVAVIPFDLQVHDTYFVVAHFHYVLIGGVVFPIFAAIHYWWPKVTGRLMRPWLGHASFWLTFVGFNATFFPMHLMGFRGMPRRVYTYSEELKLDGYNALASGGALVLGLGTLALLVNAAWSRLLGPRAPDDPWRGDSLEWSVASPPRSYSFYEPPRVRAIHHLWAEPRPGEPPASLRARRALAGGPTDFRATLATDGLAAEPESIHWLPGPNPVPLVAALGLVLAAVGVLFGLYAVGAMGAVVACGAFAVWLWADTDRLDLLRRSSLPREAGLPIFTTGARSVAWWGLIGGLACTGTSLAALLYSYFYIRLYSEQWPQDGYAPPELLLPGVAFGSLVAAGPAMWWARRGFLRGRTGGAHAGLGAAICLAAAFVAIHLIDLSRVRFTPQTNAYGSLFYVLGAFVWLLALTGVAFNIAGHRRLALDGAERHTHADLQIQITTHFWYFVAAVSAIVYAAVYLSPHVL